MPSATPRAIRSRPDPGGQLAAAAEAIFGRRPPREVPARVRAAIAADQRSGEILVCTVQFAALVLFGAVYALTPKAFPPSVPFEPIPWALGLYALFTCLRLWLAITERLSPPFLGVSVIVDVSVLMLTIWSFHLQYQEPATIYLKAPTLLYVFILIALRAMRFEAVYVVLAGLSAIVGWAVLVGYAVYTSDGMQITRNFAEYARSNAILIGAEVDKILSIAAVTAILAIAIVRARRLLIRAATEAYAARQLSRFLAPEVAQEIRAADGMFAPGDAVTRDAAVLIFDLRGFTRLAASLPPAATVALLRDYHHQVVPAIQRHGGSIDKYMGDGIMATFGAANPSPTYAADALQAIEAVFSEGPSPGHDRFGHAAPRAEINAGLAVGPVLFGVTGDETRLEFTVIGDVVNQAAKLEKHCKLTGDAALATAAAVRIARAQGFTASAAWLPRAEEDVAGLDRPVDLVAYGPRGARPGTA